MKLLPVLKTIFTVAILTAHTLTAKIVEAPHFADILPYATPGTLIILDIDDTLLIPVQTLGSDVWFAYRYKQNKASGMESDVAIEKTLAEWESIRHITSMKTPESDTADIVKTMQDKGVAVIAMTTQGITLSTRTNQHLHSVNIDMSRTSPEQEDYYFINTEGMSKIYAQPDIVTIGHENDHRGVLLRGGVFFTAGSNKGTALTGLLEHFGVKWQGVVFINDKNSHLVETEAAMEKLGIPFVGLRYSHGDKRVKSFREDVADVQFKHSTFQHILSDEEATDFLK